MTCIKEVMDNGGKVWDADYENPDTYVPNEARVSRLKAEDYPITIDMFCEVFCN